MATQLEPAVAPAIRRRRTIESQRSMRRPRAYTPSLFPPAASHGNAITGSEASRPPANHSGANGTVPSGKPAPCVVVRADQSVALACLDGSNQERNVRLPNGGQLVGIARLAAHSPLAGEKRDTEYFLLPVRSVLNRCDSPRMPFEWTINPYRGCEFGCRYCYARYTHEFMELDGHDFEKKIFVKKNAANLLAKDLEEESARVSSLFGKPEQIALGTATDPYQPAERDFGVTRALLEKMAEREGLDLAITTKSDQIVRDIDVLKKISARSALAINITITTPRPRLARMLEPRAPRPDLRFAAVRKLREAGLHTGVFVMPILPGLTDRESDLEILARSAHQAGAEWLSSAVLWLMPAARKELLPFIEEKFPRLARDYRKWYMHSAYAPQYYREEIALRVSRVRSRYRLANRPYFTSPRPAAAPAVAPQRQLSLRLPAAS